jgi:predicted nucleotidyltransferase
MELLGISLNRRAETLNATVAEYRTELIQLCCQFHVRKLELFGSALGDAYDPERSDLDFLVEFEAIPDGGYAASFFGFKESLEKLFGRPVDLVVGSAIRNPYFLQSIEQSKALLYVGGAEVSLRYSGDRRTVVGSKNSWFP